MPADSFVGIWKFVARPNLCETPALAKPPPRYGQVWRTTSIIIKKSLRQIIMSQRFTKTEAAVIKRRAMETRDHSKNGASSKSQMSRFFIKRGSLFIISLLLTFSISSYAQSQQERENAARKLEQQARETSDLSKANALRLEAQGIRNGTRPIGTQSQTNSSQQPQNVQASGWYYTTQQYGEPKKTTVRLIIQKRETGRVRPQYLIVSIDGREPNQSTLANYDDNTGLYVFTIGNTRVYFNP